MSDDRPAVGRSLRLIALVLGRSITQHPAMAVMAGLELLGKVFMALTPIFLGLITVALVQRSWPQFILGAGGLLLGTTVNGALQLLGTSARLRQMQLVGFDFDAEVTRWTAAIPTLDHLEVAEILDKGQAVRNNALALGGALNDLLNIINSLAWALVTIIVAASADARMLLLLVASLPPLFVQPLVNRWAERAMQQDSEPARLSQSLLGLSLDAAAGAEVRVFGAGPMLRQRLRQATLAWRTPTVWLARRASWVSVGLVLAYLIPAMAVLGWLLRDYTRGTVSLWAFSVAVTSVVSLRDAAMTLVQTSAWIAGAVRVGERYLWFKDHAEAAIARHQGGGQPPERLTQGITLAGVSFRYGGADTDALSEISLQRPAGSVVAVVGENGAGKTTLAKLLTGMYDPTEGQLLVDGQALTSLDLQQWRRQCSGAFQDHLDLQFTAAEAIGAGDLTQLENRAAIERALADAAAEDVLDALPDGLDTQLGVEAGGVGLSGGQWQRIALARAMMRRQPLLLVLDEPTAALDAAAEDLLFTRYAAASALARERGGVTVLITHRFSTVASADLVVVLVGGRVAEVGRHADLIAAGGAYAELYELQAAGYR